MNYRQCKICGRKFPLTTSQPRQVYCSQKCKVRARSVFRYKYDLTPGTDTASKHFKKKLREEEAVKRRRIMVALACQDLFYAALHTPVSFARVGRAIVESRGRVPIHNGKAWAVA